MNIYNRNLLVFFHTGGSDEKFIEKQAKYLHQILLNTESAEQFCRAHELVDRNRITSDSKKILRETSHFRMRRFRFLINKN